MTIATLTAPLSPPSRLWLLSVVMRRRAEHELAALMKAA
jgi:hypothetical protein